MKKSLRQRDSWPPGQGRDSPDISRKEKAACAVASLTFILLLGAFFYRSGAAMLVLLPLSLMQYRKQKNSRVQARKRELAVQFRDCLLSVSASLRAGYSVENAFRESVADMRMLFGTESRIVKELESICKGMGNNIQLEKLLIELGAESGNQDIRDFAEVFRIAKRGGGSLTEVIQSTVDLIGDRIDTEQEIYVLASGKRLEQRLMRSLPFVIVLYIEAGNPGYFAPLYHNAFGILLMTVCLGLYLTAGYMADKILNSFTE